MPFLSGDRVALEPLDPVDESHVAAFRTTHNHPAMRPTGGYETGLTAGEARDLLREYREGTGPVVAILAEGEIAGWARAHLTDERARVVELSVYVLPDHQGNGYATDAVRRLTSFAFRTLDAASLVARVRADNGASVRVLEKVGFVREGTRRRAYYKAGDHHDVAVFGLLPEEFEEGGSAAAAETTEE